jgi:hypothetical protein
VPSEPVHGVGSNLDLIEANDTAQASERRRLGLIRCCDDPRPFGICIWAINVWWPWPKRRGSDLLLQSRLAFLELRQRIEACSRPCLTAAMMF